MFFLKSEEKRKEKREKRKKKGMDRNNIQKGYKCVMANTTYQLTNAIQKRKKKMSLNEKCWRIFWKTVRRMDQSFKVLFKQTFSRKK